MLAKAFTLNIAVKIISAFLGLASIPLLIKSLGIESYGLWVTLTSIIGWLSILDLGVGHALKNTVSRAVAENDFRQAQKESQQVFKLTFFISLFAILLLLISTYYMDFLKNNKTIVLLIYIPVLLAFPLSMGAMIMQGARKMHIQSAIGLIAPASVFFYVLFFVYFDMKMDFFAFAAYYTFIFVFMWCAYWFFASKEIYFTREFYAGILRAKIINNRLGVSLRFFILQVSSIILYGAGNFLVYNYSGAVEAAEYDTINKLYFFGLTVFNMAIAIFWPEITYSITKNEYSRAKKIYFVMLALCFVFIFGSIVVSFYAVEIINYWTSGEVQVDKVTPFYFALLVSIQALAYSGAVVLNALEKITGQLILSVFSSVAMIPLFFYLHGNDYGVASVPIAAALLTFVAMVYCNLSAILNINKGLKGAANVN